MTEALIGPDVYALQSMLFLNPPGKGGQGWHQDSCYIKTHPDTLIGAWIALEEVDEENGCYGSFRGRITNLCIRLMESVEGTFMQWMRLRI